MKKVVLAAALTAAALGFSSLVMAEGAEGDNRSGPGPNQQRMQRQPAATFPNAHGPLRRALRADPNRREGNYGYDGRNGYQGGNQGRGGYEGRGAGPDHNFYRGGRLPQQYRGHQYVVDDWRGHHLSAPPRGYQWVQTGGDYVLVAIATGIIAQLLLSQ